MSAESSSSQPADVLPVAIRAAELSDFPFIADTWRTSYQDTMRPATGKERTAYHAATTRKLRLLWERGANFAVACWPGDPDYLMGFICWEGPVVHYAYVKQGFRRQGIALQLLNAAGQTGSQVCCSHWSSSLDQIAIKRPSLLKYVGLEIPAVLRGIYEQTESGQQAVH